MTKHVKQTFKENGQPYRAVETYDEEGNLTYATNGKPYRDENGVLTRTTYCEGEIIQDGERRLHTTSRVDYREDGSLESKTTYSKDGNTPEPGGM